MPAESNLSRITRTKTVKNRRRSPDWLRGIRRRAVSTQPVVVILLAVAGGIIGIGIAVAPEWVSPSALIILLIFGGYLLRIRAISVLCSLLLVVSAVVWFLRPTIMSVGDMIMAFIVTIAVVMIVRVRERFGLQGAISDLMLVDLRDRLRAQGQVPSLGRGWKVETAVRAAHGDAFSGDFVVAIKRPRSSWMELALVDVSGKGQAAGVRALQLSGAFGGLLGSMERENFLSAANEYVLRQNWAEGFATALHLSINLNTGQYEVAGAGHPPPAHLHAGSGQFEMLRTSGVALGVLASAGYPRVAGEMHNGDALILYTDGLVEKPDSDVEMGIDRLLGVVEQVVGAGRGDGGVGSVLELLSASPTDDRAMVVLRRTL